jgi:F-type H+-transporting ATPase subunit b
VVVFVLLMVVLRRFAWGPILQGLHSREQSIRAAIEDAQRARQDSQALRDQLQRELDQAHVKVREMLDEARRDAQHAKDEMVAEARKEIQTERDRLRREVDLAKDQALQEIWVKAADLAALVSAKAIGRNITGDDHRRLVDEAVAGLIEARAHRNN